MTDKTYRIAKSWYSHGLYAVAVFHKRMGHYCGYIGVPEGHPAYGKGYDDVNVDVHGGLTYADNADNYPEPNPKRYWFFGFDCAHSGDRPSDEYLKTLSDISRTFYENHGVFRDLTYVIDECQKLAKQLAEYKEPTNETGIANPIRIEE